MEMYKSREKNPRGKLGGRLLWQKRENTEKGKTDGQVRHAQKTKAPKPKKTKGEGVNK